MASDRPRVAAISLDKDQAKSIEPLCGTLRTAESVQGYVKYFSWTETDIVIGVGLGGSTVGPDLHVLAISPQDSAYAGSVYVTTDTSNTEREVTSLSGRHGYGDLARNLAKQLRRSEEPPAVLLFGGRNTDREHLVETTSGHPVAARFTLRGKPERDGNQSQSEGNQVPDFIVLALPQVDNLAEWFRVFLSEVNRVDKTRVPHAPPRLLTPEDWYTPEEKRLARRIAGTRSEINQLKDDLEQFESELKAETNRADAGVRRGLSADGDELVAAVGEMLSQCGFSVEYMDAALGPKDARWEDLRLTIEGRSGWEAIVEVKGYVKGVKTSDARQIREQRDHYAKEKKGRFPCLTLWIANPYRLRDPSSRPAPDRQATEAAENIGATYVAVPDLYRLWSLVADGSMPTSSATRQLVDSQPGLWVGPTKINPPPVPI